VLFERVKRRIDKGARCIVVDPRRTATAEAATLHLPIHPGTDLTLLNGLLRLMKNWGKLDEAFVAEHTEGWQEMLPLLSDYSPDDVAERCRIPRDALISAARMLADTPRHITFWTMGVNQTLQGTFASNAIINLHLALGRIGKPGAGPFSLTGQPNAMGGRDVGYMSHLLPGQRNIADAAHRAEMEKIWATPPGAICAQPGYDAVRMFEAMEAGEIRAIWIVGSNPAASMPNLPQIRRALEKCELVIVQDAYTPTETSKYADVLLPAAVNLEQDGTFCNSERRVSLMQKVVPPPGDAKPDWQWVRDVAAAMGFFKGMAFDSAEQIFDEFARSTAGRPNDQSGLYYTLLRSKGPQLWPRPALGGSVERRYSDGVFPTASGKAKFWARRDLDPEERVSADFPLLLTTGRTKNQWHTRTKTGQVRQLNELDPEPFLQIHSSTAAELSLNDGDAVTVTSQRGQSRSHLKIDDTISPGVVFLPIHWNELWREGASPNEATRSDADAISKQPALKCCAVRVEAVDAAAPEEQALQGPVQV
jgi:sulfite reductase (NADPH) flavoprotein alpha-component